MSLKHQDDLFGECYDGAARQQTTPEQFQQLICAHCRQPKCKKAKWGRTPFDIKVQTWAERLFGDERIISDLTNSKHVDINELDFADISRKALRLEVADRRGDWEFVPEEEAITSGMETTNQVDEAVRKLAQLQGKKPPGIPQTEPDEVQEKVLEEPSEEELQEDPEEEWTDKELQRAQRLDKEAGVNTRPPPREGKRQTPAQGPTLVNTPFPQQGVMLDGDESPKAKQGERSKATEDPWAPKPKAKVMKPGATVRLGGDDDG